MYLIDTHAHLNDSKFASDLPEVIARANEAGVGRIIVCGYDLESSRAAVELASRFECVFATVGVHPHDSKSFDESTPQALVELSRRPKVLAIGETGLDFHYHFSPRSDQFAAFEAQIELAGNVGLPIVVHSRESNAEVLQVLRQHSENIQGCVLHCFSGDEQFAREVLDEGFYIGIDGPITYKASEKLRRVVEMCPLDRLLIETDCPYLTPVPHRGKRNEPAYVRYVAEEVARIRGRVLEELAEATTRNARALFGTKL
ncbi:MAG: TatD family hydrolase [Armatimonadetes bacterium]|nr:TatD family hydrolase [Armatimonadota bacterium]